MARYNNWKRYNRKLQSEISSLRAVAKAASKPMTVKRVNGMIANLKGKIKIAKAEMASEIECLARLEAEYAAEAEEIEKVRVSLLPAITHHQEATATITDARSRISVIAMKDKEQRGFFERLFGDDSLSPEAKRQTAEQNEIIHKAALDLLNPFPTIPSSDRPKRIETSRTIIRNTRHAIALWEARLAEHETLKQKLLVEEAQKNGKEKAMVAAYLDKTRELAAAIKDAVFIDQVKRCPRCPYCGGEYGDNPQADHIYAVTHGGLSTFENMVYVCLACNQRKSDRTLREFIRQHGLDRGRVEATLESLGKKF